MWRFCEGEGYRNPVYREVDMPGKRRGSHRRKRAGGQLPARAEVVPRSQKRERWTGGRPGRGLYLPIADELDEKDLPRLLRAAEKQQEANRRRMGIPSVNRENRA